MSELRKAEYIAKHGEAAYKQKLARKRERARELYKLNQEKMQEKSRKYRVENQEKVKVANKRYYEDHREERIAQSVKWSRDNPEKKRIRDRKYHRNNPEKAKATRNEICRKGGKYYEKHLIDKRTGLEGAKNRVRAIHQAQYRPFKRIIAPDSQIHHEWIPQTDKYRGVALVEAKPHQYGIIDVILILDGKITLLTEARIKRKEEKDGKRK